MVRLKKRSKPPIGIFTKLSLAFVLVGLVPLLLISVFFLGRFSASVRNTILNDAGMLLDSAAGSTDALLSEWDALTTKIYAADLTSGPPLAELLLDSALSEEQRAGAVRQQLMAMNELNGLTSVRFLSARGALYSVSEQVGKLSSRQEMERWRLEELSRRDPTSHAMALESAHVDSYFSNLNDTVITVKRNLFNAASLDTVNDFLGTVYFDVSESVVTQQLMGLELHSGSGFYIIDQTGADIYKSENQRALPAPVLAQLTSSGATSQVEDDSAYYLGKPNQSGGWKSVIKIDKSDVLADFEKTEKYILTVLCVSCSILLLLYFTFSRNFSIPVRRLKEGMVAIQNGNLDTRVSVESRDELGVLSDGLNQMAAKLSEYIERVYGAEIKQRDAELKALKSQIKPHYLYNTLDLIRMTALDNDGQRTAGMIENLARQLRYLMGEESETVPLERELANVEDYFSLVRVSMEERIDLKISAPEDLRQTPILKLVLQPLVENAVKHGLRPKPGRGAVWIDVCAADGAMEITVLDDGVGMDSEQLAALDRHGVGIQNVRERIQKKYGAAFGLEIRSTKGAGTFAVLRVPCAKEARDDESDFDR